MRIGLIICCMFGATIMAQNEAELRMAIINEIDAIRIFASEQSDLLEKEKIESSDDTLCLAMLNSDTKEYYSLSINAQKHLEQMEKGLSIAWAKIYLQLLRNKIYALHDDHEQLHYAGINRRSRSLFESGMDFVSNSSSLLIKCAGTIMALKTIYEISPNVWQYFISSACSLP